MPDAMPALGDVCTIVLSKHSANVARYVCCYLHTYNLVSSLNNRVRQGAIIPNLQIRKVKWLVLVAKGS